VFGTAVLTDRQIGEELEVPKTAVAPTIDGTMDDVWVEAAPFQQNSFDNIGSPGNWPDSYEDLAARDWAMYDDANMYLFIEAWDDILIDTHANTYERDCFEIYFDGDNSKGAAYDNVNDMQLRIGHAYTEAAQIDAQSYFGRDGVEFVNVDRDAAGWVPYGWNLEVKLPLAGIFVEPVADGLFGFEIQGNDNDATGRDAISKWWLETGDASWNNASSFGTAYTSSRVINGSAVENRTPQAGNFSLGKNYPNPFNPTTTIPYSLKKSGRVRLSVFDMMGKEVAVLIDGVRPEGADVVRFDGSDLSSGIYFYKLQTADNVSTGKMTMVK
jgi:hypothetical protein